MYPPQYNLPPINPAAFGGLPPQGGPQGGPPPTQGGPQGGPPPTQGGPQGGPPMDMNKYLIDKVMEIKRRMGGGEPGALGAITEAMISQPQPQPQLGPQQVGMG
jgi:hypothetical protein